MVVQWSPWFHSKLSVKVLLVELFGLTMYGMNIG